MKKFGALLLACLMMVSALSFSASANDYGIMPCWNNTNDLIIAHKAVGTTACCQIDMNIAIGATITNNVIRLIDVDEGRIVKTWTNPTMTVDAVNTHSFYDEVPGITNGHVYQLTIQCQVWRNGVYDTISDGVAAQY